MLISLTRMKQIQPSRNAAAGRKPLKDGRELLPLQISGDPDHALVRINLTEHVGRADAD